MPESSSLTATRDPAPAAPPKASAPPKRRRLRTLLRRSGCGLFVLMLAIAVYIGFGTSTADLARLQTFVSSVNGWQHDTEFRRVTLEYVDRGSAAMATRPMGFRSATWIMAIRSLPGMPSGFAVNDTSRAHYENFSRGPLSGYLHLCTEVDLADDNGNGGYLAEIQDRFGGSKTPDTASMHDWLNGLKWDYAVNADGGAVQSLRSMIRDAQLDRPLTIRARHLNTVLQPHIAALAHELQIKTTVAAEMTVQEQQAIFARLDDHVRQTDPELWRTKQVGDFIGGIWGQVFSPPYLVLLSPYLKLVMICRWLVLAALVGLVVWAWRQGRAEDKEQARVPAMNALPATEPSAASAGGFDLPAGSPQAAV